MHFATFRALLPLTSACMRVVLLFKNYNGSCCCNISGILYLANMSSVKSVWPEVLGLPANVAEQMILNDRPDVQVLIVPPGGDVPRDFDDQRVIVFVDSAGNVDQIPTIG